MHKNKIKYSLKNPQLNSLRDLRDIKIFDNQYKNDLSMQNIPLNKITRFVSRFLGIASNDIHPLNVCHIPLIDSTLNGLSLVNPNR